MDVVGVIVATVNVNIHRITAFVLRLKFVTLIAFVKSQVRHPLLHLHLQALLLALLNLLPILPIPGIEFGAIKILGIN
jgi:hypothetical protein